MRKENAAGAASGGPQSTCPSRPRSLPGGVPARHHRGDPLNIYTITLADVLGQAELDDQNIQKEYYLERIDLNSRFIQANVNSVAIENVFKELDTRGRTLDVRSLIQVLLNEKVNKDTVVQLLRGFGLSDATITKAFGYVG